MADDDKRTPAQKAGSATKAVHSGDKVVSGDFPQEGDNVSEDGEFAGHTRYEGSVLVERKVGDDWVTVMTDNPRPGDRVQQHTLDRDTGELTHSSESTTKAGATRLPGKS
ncbi:MAG: hypothetical protein WC054_01080 [Candidatus Nanopelagicales bacterium]